MKSVRSRFSFPIHSVVDVVIIGASSASVSAALELRASGRSILVVSDRSYFGEETAGRWVLSDAGMDRGDPLVRRVFPDAGRRVFPCAIKHTLEMALLESGVKLLYLCRPIALLRDEEEKVAGVLLGHRTAPFAVRCRAVIDATTHGIVAKLAGVSLSTTRSWPQESVVPIICRAKPEAWADRLTVADGPLAAGEEGQGEMFPVYHLRTPLPETTSQPAAWMHVSRATWVDGAVDMRAEVLDIPTRDVFWPLGRLQVRFEELEDSEFQPQPGLWLAGGALPLISPESRLDRVITLGRRVAEMVRASLSQQPSALSSLLQAVSGGEERDDYRFDEAFLRCSEGFLELPEWTFPSLGVFDVVVAGGGTAGACAGIAAARAGAKTLVLEMLSGLGGVGTLGLIASYWFGNRVGFTEELRQEICKLDPSHKGTTWHPETKSGIYHQLLRKAGGTAWMESFACGVRMRGDSVTGVLVSTPQGCGVVSAGCVVDATGSADIAAAAGAPCRVIGAQHAAVQGTGLPPRFVGSRYVNTDHTFVDDNDCVGVTHAFINARAKFPDAFDVPSVVDSRERRQIHGEIELSPLDVLAGRSFPDTIVTAISNFDTHGFTEHPVFALCPPNKEPNRAHVPFRCLLPLGVENMLVTGLGVSAHRDALPVIRMQADVQNQGYAAGLAAAFSAKRGIPLRNLDVRELQQQLVNERILDPAILAHKDSFPLDEDFVKKIVHEGLPDQLRAAVLLAEPDKSTPYLVAQLSEATAPDLRQAAALVLGMLGRSEAAPVLIEALDNASWDKGWNYTGMGQFGASQSRMDACIVALALSAAGTARSMQASSLIAKKARELDAMAEFSHCRAIALAATLVPSFELEGAIRSLLSLPGMRGNTQTDSLTVALSANRERNETLTRNLALRELYLARGLFAIKPNDLLARAILESYAMDLRGVFARHAAALLAAASS